MMNLTFGLFTQVSGSGPLGPLVLNRPTHENLIKITERYHTAFYIQIRKHIHER